MGIKGNEEADRLAKLSITQDNGNIEKTYFKDFKALLKDKMRIAWQREWSDLIANSARNNILEEIKPHIGFLTSSQSVSVTRNHSMPTETWSLQINSRPPNVPVPPKIVYPLPKSYFY